MTTITIDEPLCSGCGTCSAVCPYFILVRDGSKTAPVIDPVRVNTCVHCGHCQAVCPEGAITVSYAGEGELSKGKESGFVPSALLGTHIMSRRSIRDFLSDPVPEELLRQILDIVRYAPSGMNGQPVHWTVITEPEKIHDIVGSIINWARNVEKNQPGHPLAPILPMVIKAWDSGADPVCHHAPALLLAHGYNNNPNAYTDSIIALTHLDLIAPSFGLGTCWAGFVQIGAAASPEITRALCLPKGHVLQHAMLAGFPKYHFRRIPKRDALRVTWR